MQKIIHILLLILFFSIPLVHGQLLKTLGVDFGIGIAGNYEFLKTQFFIFISGLIFILFGIQTLIQKKEIVFPKILFPIIGILGISTLFSISSYTSLFGLNTKGHGSLMFLSLIGIYLVLIQQEKDLMKKLFYSSVFGAFLASLIAIKEYYTPSLGYGELSNRALGTFGHPNYLVAYLLLLVPFLLKKIKQQKLLVPLVLLIIFTIFLTKSAWGILLFLSYLIYLIIQKKNIKKSHAGVFIVIFLIIFSYIIYQFGLYTKLHSFLSRFYIWETTLKIIIDNPKILLFGSGADTLLSYFESYKSPLLYIFENFGFSSDRPHNLFLNILFHFGIGGVFIFLYLIFKLLIHPQPFLSKGRENYKKYKNNYLYHSLILILLFTFFNFLSVASYLIIILISSCISIQKYRKFSIFFPAFFIITGIFSVYTSYNYASSEAYAFSGNYEKAITVFPYNYKNYEYFGDIKNIEKYAGYLTKNGYISQLDTKNTESICDKYIADYNSVESAFYCGNYAWILGEQDLAKEYYTIGLERIPDLWNKNSPYYSNIFISQSIDGKRFFSEKYSNLEEILERIGIENDF